MQRISAKPIPPLPAGARPGQDRSEMETLLAIARAAWQRRWAAIVCILLPTIGAGIYCAAAARLYKSQAHLEAHQLPALQSDTNDAPEQTAVFLSVQTEVIKSDPVLAAALQLMPEHPQAAPTPDAAAIAKLRSGIEVTSSALNQMLTISAIDRSTEGASRMVNAVVAAYVDHRKNEVSAQYQKSLATLTLEKQQVQADLDKTNSALESLKNKYADLISGSDGQSVESQEMQKLAESLAAAHVETLNDRVLMDAAIAASGDPRQLLQVLTASGSGLGNLSASVKSLDDLLQKRAKLMQTASELTAKYGELHQAVQQTYRQLDDVTEQIADAARVVAAGAVEMHAMAQGRESAIRASIDAEHDKQARLAEAGVEYARLQGDLRRYNQLLDDINNRFSELELWNRRALETVNVVEPAIADAAPVSPQRAAIWGIGLGSGFASAVAAILILELSDGRFRSAEEIYQRLQLQVMGSIPQMPGQASLAARAQETRLSPGSRAAEAFRQFMAAMLFRAGQIDARTILVSSPERGNGRTTVACNLAIACAQTGRRVLLVDADCRNPSLHLLFGLTETAGLSGVLLGSRTLDSVIQPTETSNLDLLPCGPMSAHTAGLLHGQQFCALLESMRNDYDRIIFDACSVDSASDALLIASVVDSTLLVLQADRTTRKSAELGRSALISAGARLMGIAVNRAAIERDDFRHRQLIMPTYLAHADAAQPSLLRKAV
jgi:polysaccharide biosynthesis transport protein